MLRSPTPTRTRTDRWSTRTRITRISTTATDTGLLTSDGIESISLFLTHDFLAAMLGVHRPGVTQAASALMEAESITYTRGSVRITNRRLLEGFACECYPFLKEQRDLFLSGDGK